MAAQKHEKHQKKETDDKIPPESPISTKMEKKQVEERTAIGAAVVYEAIRMEGEDELLRPAQALAWSGLAAGLSMGFSFIAEGLLAAYLPNEPWAHLISRLGYSVGFLIVVLGRQQLFTENTLTVILPLLAHRSRTVLNRVLKLWAVVLVTNVAGTYLFALCVAHVPIFEPPVRQALIAIGKAHLSLGFGEVFIGAIFAGWLIALMVWLLPAAESARVSIIVLITYLIGLGSFGHVIAGSTTVLFLVALKTTSWGAYLGSFFLPTLMGNIIGGVSLVAALGHAQVVGGREG
ncbi:MAG: formate/nitrite transporter family protein [Candidatus Acidiferrales bacterium]